jgi:hypothetical protein
MDFNFYNQVIDEAIRELIDMKIELSHVERGIVPPKCNPVIINPSTGEQCRPMLIDLRVGDGLDDIQDAFRDWLSGFQDRMGRLGPHPE